MKSNPPVQAGSGGRDHGGDLAAAISEYGGTRADWTDLSTGINPIPYPIPALEDSLWSTLPDRQRILELENIAARYFGLNKAASCLAISGAQAGIQLIPGLAEPGQVGVLGPTYNEHAASFRSNGFDVVEINSLRGIPDNLTALVLVNPNNPTGQVIAPEKIEKLSKNIPLVVVDESFADPTPDLSICSGLGETGTIVLRSFGKFFGLAGLRLGFALGASDDIEQLREYAGPWSVNGPAIAIGCRAYRDENWISATRKRLQRDMDQLVAMALASGFKPVGGTSLFHLFEVENAAEIQAKLASQHIWTRIFPYSRNWIRLGLPGSEENWHRLGQALRQIRN